MILIVLFFFLTLFTLLLFGFPSHFAHCSSCSFLSASFPLERHSPSAPLFHSYAWFLAHMSVWFTLSPLLAFAFYARFFFLVAQPILSLSFPIPLSASPPPLLVRLETRFTPGLELGDSYPSTTPLMYLCLSSHPIAGLVPPKSPPPPVPPLIARG